MLDIPCIWFLLVQLHSPNTFLFVKTYFNCSHLFKSYSSVLFMWRLEIVIITGRQHYSINKSDRDKMKQCTYYSVKSTSCLWQTLSICIFVNSSNLVGWKLPKSKSHFIFLKKQEYKLTFVILSFTYFWSAEIIVDILYSDINNYFNYHCRILKLRLKLSWDQAEKKCMQFYWSGQLMANVCVKQVIPDFICAICYLFYCQPLILELSDKLNKIFGYFVDILCIFINLPA